MDIKETKELVTATNELSIFLIGVLKDGIQVKEDIEAVIEKLTKDDEFKAKLSAAFEGVKLVPAEVKDLSIGESAELIMLQASYVPKIWEAVKK